MPKERGDFMFETIPSLAQKKRGLDPKELFLRICCWHNAPYEFTARHGEAYRLPHNASVAARTKPSPS